jgi:hypothetical protein
LFRLLVSDEERKFRNFDIRTKKSLEVAAENLKEASTPPRPDEPKTPPPKKPKTG